ncbi:alpha/beta hydrolase [Cohnella pontilimi]|uniref:Alpha/beta hydrolase n=1 Tax=Cohnella pontilimi TaxID=2564100 RepID=A0A4U0F1Z9_9BACL|nr:alpha/beta hydrolase [Cohnella pontilimi]TJY38501.1 alpha/beta hydrolase [Cohnella pontilimi]
MTNQQSSSAFLPGFEQKGTGIPVVLLHGYLGSRRYWHDVFPALVSQYRVIMADVRGHASSPATEGVYTMEQLAEDTLALLNRYEIPKAYVFGHSLSGYSTLALAEKYPDRLLGFGLIHSTPLADTDTAKEGRLQTAERVKTEGVAAVVDGLIPKLFAPANRTAMEHKVTAAKEIGYSATAQGAIGCALGMRERPDRTHVLRDTKLPVLLLAGEHDEVIPPDRRFPVSGDHIKAVTLPGTGHMSMMEDPSRLADEIVAFIEKNEGNRA